MPINSSSLITLFWRNNFMKKYLRFSVVSKIILTSFLSLIACETYSGASNIVDTVAGYPTWIGWHVAPNNPIIKAGDLMEKGLWNDPSVLIENNRYTMYLTSSSPQAPFNPPILPFRAVSKDGLNWSLDPKKPLMDVSGTPFVSIETPSVIKINGVYHMYYTGVYPAGSAAPYAVGHAVSNNGINWKKDAKPVLTATGKVSDWNGFLVGEPGAVVYNNKIYVYFSAVAQTPEKSPSQTIGVAVSSDGTNFEKPRIAISQSNLYPTTKTFCGYSTPAALVYNGRIHLFYDVATFNKNADPNWQQTAIHHAVSYDEGKSFYQDNAPIFTRNQFDWTQGEIRAPFPLVDGNKLDLWFAGNTRIPDLRPMIINGIKGRQFGIGYASISLSEFNAGAKTSLSGR